MTTAALWTAGLVWAAALAILTTAVVIEPEDFRPVVSDACDQAVHALLTTKDMVELERSKYLVAKLRCRVSPRLAESP